MSTGLRHSLPILALVALVCLGWWWGGASRQTAAVVSSTETAASTAVASALPVDATLLSKSQPTPEQGVVQTGGKFQAVRGKPPGPGISSAEAMKAEVKDYIKEISPDEVRVGEVRLLKRERTLIFTATVAVRAQALEYALVHETGKAHEALLVTKVPVQDVHVAALLIEANGQVPKIEVSWRKNGGEARVALSDLIRVQQVAADTLSANPWTYNGSEFHQGGFAAMSEGSMVALVNDPAALVNHRAAAALQRDDVFFANAERLPADGVPVSVMFIFPASN